MPSLEEAVLKKELDLLSLGMSGLMSAYLAGALALVLTYLRP